MPLNIGRIHLIGIGGIGISGIAEILHNLGYSVSGSDIADNANVARLRKMGIVVFIGHQASNIEGAAVIVYSTAVSADNPEIVAARVKNIPVLHRAEMLAEIARLKATVAIAGTHGKTTTTTMNAAMFAAAKLDPTIINGGIINAYGTNAVLGKGDWLVVEADESDGTFIRIPSTIGIVTNIDAEHLDYWKTFDNIVEGFRTFIKQLPFYGLAVLCNDHPVVARLAKEITDRRIVTYALNDDADLRATNLRFTPEGTRFDVGDLKDLLLPMPGVHNVQNALSAIAVAQELQFGEEVIRSALANFSGVKRRFTKTGEGKGITVIDDYGHHPKEIQATLAAARTIQQTKGKIIAVAQPHRYSRLSSLFDGFCNCFTDADTVIITEVYSAGEQPIAGYDRDTLVACITKTGHKNVHPLPKREDLAALIAQHAKAGDMVVCLGAGSISQWAYQLPEELQAV
jgi:UDP-N-acetylmuramate--alanine ligase